MKKAISMFVVLVSIINLTLPVMGIGLMNTPRQTGINNIGLEHFEKDRTRTKRKFTQYVRENDTVQGTNFSPDILEYKLYLLNEDSKIIKLIPRTFAKTDTIKINGGYAVDPDTLISLKPNLLQYESNNTNLKKEEVYLDTQGFEKIEIDVNNDDSTENTRYIINIATESKGELEPKIHLEIENNIDKTELVVSVENTFAHAFSFEIYLSQEDTYKGIYFSDLDTKHFTNINIDLSERGIEDKKNYKQIAMDAIVTDMRSDGKTLKISVGTADGYEYIKSGKKSHEIIRINLDGAMGINSQNIIQGIFVKDDRNTNNMYDKRYFEIFDNAKSNKKTSLIYIGDGLKLSMDIYISHQTFNDLIEYEIYGMDPGKEGLVVRKKQSIDTKIINEDLLAGNYKIIIKARGHLTTFVDINITDKNISIPSIKLKAGDLNTDFTISDQTQRVIDGVDRAMLIEVFNLETKHGAIVNGFGDTIYPDFNKDDKVNALDLGHLLANLWLIS